MNQPANPIQRFGNIPSKTVPQCDVQTRTKATRFPAAHTLTLLFLLSVLNCPAQTCVSPPTGLVSWWAGENSAQDRTGTNHGFLQNGTSFASGIVSNAFNFDGANDFVSIPASMSLNVGAGAGFTLECWIRPDHTSSQQVIAEWNNGTGGVGVSLMHSIGALGGLGSLFADIADTTGGSHYFATAAGVLVPGNSYHVALRYDKASGLAKIFLNGAVSASAALGTFTPQTSYPLYLGTRFSGTGTGSYQDGRLDEVALYDHALTDGEILAIYNAGIAGKCVTNTPPPPPTNNCIAPPSGIVSWWRAEGNANDELGGNNGTASGGVKYAGGEVGQAFDFDGGTGDVVIPAATNLAFESLTIETWIMAGDLGNPQPIVEYGNATGPCSMNFWHGMGPGITSLPGCLSGFFRDPGGAMLGVETAGGFLQSNQWSHVALTYDASTFTARLYHNGVNVGASTSLESVRPNGLVNVNLGYRPVGSADLFGGRRLLGKLDETSIYNRALSGAEIQAIFNAGIAGKCTTPQPPVILTHPTNNIVSVGDTALLAVVAAGSTPLRYQWTFKGSPLAAATNSTLTISGVGTNHAGDYFVTVTNQYGSAVSSNATLTVLTFLPSITVQPTNQTVAAGGTAIFTVGASGSPELSYQWSFEGDVLANATNSVLTLSSINTNQAGVYAVIVTNLYGSVVSSNATLTVLVFPPSLVVQPTNQVIAAGDTATISVAVNGTQPLNYLWQFNGAPLLNSSNNPSLTLTNVSTNQAGIYSVTITNLYGSVNSSNMNLTVLILATNLFDDFEPGIDLPQWSGFGGTVLATNYGGFVSASNSLWFGGSGSRFARTRSVHTVGGGKIRFALRLSGSLGFPWDRPELPGDGVVLEYSNNNGTNWLEIRRYNTSSFTNWTSASMMLPTGAQSRATQFRWRQLSNSGTASDHWALDDVVILTVPTPPEILTQPTNQTVNLGDTPVLSAVVTGSEPLTYQWQFNGTNIAGATGSNLALTNVRLDQAGPYAAVVTNSFGLVTSSNAIVTVIVPPCSPLPSGVAGWWRGEGDVWDAQGRAVGSLVNGAGITTGRVGQAFSFDGIDDHVRVPDWADLHVTNALTVEAWVYPTSHGANRTLISKWDVVFGPNQKSYTFVVNPAGIFTLGLSATGTDSVTGSASSTNALPLNQWSHVCGTYDGTVIRIYYNGVYQTQAAYLSGIYPGTNALGIGGLIGGGSPGQVLYSFAGRIDEPTIYGRALTSAEIQNIYQAGGSGKCFVPQPPIIATQPISQTVNVSNSVSFQVVATGSSPLTYQWRFSGSSLPGETNSALNLQEAQPSQAGNYSVVITNVGGFAISLDATLKVNVVTVLGNGQPLTNSPHSFAGPVVIELHSHYTNGLTFYALDGSTPSFLSTPYAGPFLISQDSTLRAIVYRADFFEAGEADPITILFPPAYSLSLSSGGGGAVIAEPTPGPYLSNSIVRLTAAPNPGWMFLQWLGDASGNNPGTNVVMTRNKSVQAIFGTSLSTTASGGGAVVANPASGIYPYAATVRLSAVPQVGRYFALWGNAASGNVNPLSFTITNSNPTVSSLFAAVPSGKASLTVVPLGRGQVLVNPGLNIYTNGDTVTITAQAGFGQSFLGWSGDATGNQNPLLLSMDTSKLIYANFTKRPTIYFSNSSDLIRKEGPQLTIHGDVGEVHELQGGTNLQSLLPMAVLTNLVGVVEFSDRDSTNRNVQFYRAVTLP